MTSSVPHEEGTREPLRYEPDINGYSVSILGQRQSGALYDKNGRITTVSGDYDDMARIGTALRAYAAEVSRLTTERDEAQAKIDKAAELVAALVRADNNRTGLGPDGRITGADTLPLQMLLGLSLTLREGFGRPPSEGKEST